MLFTIQHSKVHGVMTADVLLYPGVCYRSLGALNKFQQPGFKTKLSYFHFKYTNYKGL